MKIKDTILTVLAEFYKKHKQKSSDLSLEHCMSITGKMLKRAKYGFLITQGDTGWCSSRLVEPFLDAKTDLPFSLWFGTSKDSRKIAELWSNPKVTLAFEDKKADANVIVYGKATIETDPAIKKQYWKSILQLFFPKGPLSNEYVVIRIEPLRIEILNFKRNIVPEPFGLKSAVLVYEQNKWQMEV